MTVAVSADLPRLPPRGYGLGADGSAAVVETAGCPHVDLGAEAQAGGPTALVDIEQHTLALADHAQDGALERVGRQVELPEIGVADQAAHPGARVVGLDHALHGRKATRRLRGDKLGP